MSLQAAQRQPGFQVTKKWLNATKNHAGHCPWSLRSAVSNSISNFVSNCSEARKSFSNTCQATEFGSNRLRAHFSAEHGNNSDPVMVAYCRNVLGLRLQQLNECVQCGSWQGLWVKLKARLPHMLYSSCKDASQTACCTGLSSLDQND